MAIQPSGRGPRGSGITRWLRRGAANKAGTTAEPSPPAFGEVAFGAFAQDCRVHGRIGLTAPRLSDMLNGADPLALTAVVVQGLADGRIEDVGDLIVQRDELCAVVADGPRGDRSRRLHTRVIRVEIQIGPYRIEAALHGTPASDPLSTVLRRSAFVPLTEAHISYELAGAAIHETVPALVVNCTLARSIRAADEARIDLPWLDSRGR